MDLSFLRYELVKGYVHNWLAAGPQVVPIDGAPDLSDPAIRQAMAQKFYIPGIEIKGQPLVRGKLTEGIFTIGEFQGSWEYLGCQEDHLVNHSGRYLPDSYLRSWAYTQLVSDRAIELQLHITSPGPVDLWLGRRHLLRKETFSVAWPEPVVVPVRLKRGPNPVMVRFEDLSSGDCAHFMALQVCHPDGTPLAAQSSAENAPAVSIRLPTTIMPRLLEYREHLEQLFAGIAFERDVFEGEQEIAFRLPDAPYAGEIITIRVMDLAKIIFRDGGIQGKPGQRVPLNYALELAAGWYQVELLPRVYEYYELGLRIKKDIQVWTVGNITCSKQSYGTFTERCQEGLLKAVEQKNNLFADWARMTLGWWNRVEVEQIQVVIDQVNHGEERDPLRMAGLAGMFCRFGDQPQFPAEISQPLADCIIKFNFNTDGSVGSEADRILLYACEVLAGQRFANQVFPLDGQNGDWHARKGARMAVEWLLERASLGFEDWGSSEELSRDLAALSLLVDLAEDGQLQELAVILMDKIFFALALNSFQGILGAPQRRGSPVEIRGGILQPTAGIMRLMWGLGVFNHRIEGFVSLACMKQYELPEMIARMAVDLPDEMWGQEQHASGQPANKIVYRTPDTLLSSVQDYLPGSAGARELLWQATLGPGATVFVNNPGCSFEEVGLAPGFWQGNAHLPRVAQWKNALIAIYDLPENDWMGFTHAYFPGQAFDEYCLRKGWAFARSGNGYLAISSSQGVVLVDSGPQALKELRAPGRQVTWVCHLGRAASDGDFSAFQDKILGLKIEFKPLEVIFETLLGERCSFGFQGPLSVNGSEVTLNGYPHYKNPYTETPLSARQMDIVYDDIVLRLDFSTRTDE